MQSYCEQMMHQAFHQGRLQYRSSLLGHCQRWQSGDGEWLVAVLRVVTDLVTAAEWWHSQRSVGCEPLVPPVGVCQWWCVRTGVAHVRRVVYE